MDFRLVRPERHPINLQVGFHQRCHLQHTEDLREEPRAIPGLKPVELPNLSCVTVCRSV